MTISGSFTMPKRMPWPCFMCAEHWTNSDPIEVVIVAERGRAAASPHLGSTFGLELRRVCFVLTANMLWCVISCCNQYNVINTWVFSRFRVIFIALLFVLKVIVKRLGLGLGLGTGNRKSRIETVPVLTVKSHRPPPPTHPPPNF